MNVGDEELIKRIIRDFYMPVLEKLVRSLVKDEVHGRVSEVIYNELQSEIRDAINKKVNDSFTLDIKVNVT